MSTAPTATSNERLSPYQGPDVRGSFSFFTHPRFPRAFFLMVFLVWTGCAHSGTPMHPSCRELPTVEECQAAAQVITHECLRKCVELQCTGVKVNCQSTEIQKRCKEQSSQSEGITALGYVVRFSDIPTSCNNPSKEVNWCEQPASRDCRVSAMVHELAHSCGWRHTQGFGVPGNDGVLPCE
jgi:hypothetical protein